MNVKSSITTIYRGEGEVPDNVWDKFGSTRMYDLESVRISELAVASGQNSYAKVCEWGEFHKREDAVKFIGDWTVFLNFLERDMQ